MYSKHRVTTIFLSALILFLFGIIQVKPYSAYNEDCTYLPDDNGSFYICCKDKKIIDKVMSNNSVTSYQPGYTDYDSVQAFLGHLYLLKHTKNNLIIYDCNKKKNSGLIILNETGSSENCFCTDNSGKFYVSDENEPDVIKIFSRYGEEEERISTGSYIDSLFYDDISCSVYAVCGTSIFSTSTRKAAKSVIPSENIRLINGKCTDDSGNVYSFSYDKGFSKILETDYNDICVTKESIYACDEVTIYELDINGNVLKSFSPGRKINMLISSNHTIAYISENLYILSSDDFSEPDVSDTQLDNTAEENNKNNTQNSSPPSTIEENTSLPDTSVSSDKKSSENISIPRSEIRDRAVSTASISSTENSSHNQNTDVSSENNIHIAGNYIFLDSPTTISALKKSGILEGEIISAVDYRNKTVSSGKTGTGCIINLSGNKCLTIVLYGDLTGEGNSNSRDTDLFCDYLFNKSDLSDAAALAADTDKNGELDMLDLYRLYKNM